MASKTVYQGDTVFLKYGTEPAQDLTNWTCDVAVKTTPGATAEISKSLTTRSVDKTQFLGEIDTSPLSPGVTYLVIAELTDTVNGHRKEIHDTLVIKPQGIS